MTNTENNENIRVAARSIYDHIVTMNVRGQQSPFDLTRSHSINLITEEFLRGYMQDGRMSVVRRFFCLFVTFDLVFIALLWLICIMITGDNISNAFKVQILHYSVYTSLFDVVMAAICRFTVLILFYALLYINHWIIIAFTTSGSCLFLISKVFVYNWVASSQPVFQVVLIVTSFVLAWGEAWFLDCRVIPQERHARSYFLAISSTLQPNDRSSLIAPFLSSEPDGNQPTESIANFYSPYDSIHNSDDEDEEDEEYRKAGNECVKRAYELLESSDWKIEKVTKKGDTIQSTQRDKLGKIYRLTARIKYPPKALLEELFYKIEDVPKWNPTLLESRIVKKIDTHTDITYQATIGGGGGLVKSRDFVNLRCWQVCSNGKILFDYEKSDSDDDHGSYYNDSCEGSISSVYNDDDDDDYQPLINKSTSEAKLKKENEINNSGSSSTSSAFRTLSKSLGAKDFRTNTTTNLYSEPPPFHREFLDAKDHFEDSKNIKKLTLPIETTTTTTVGRHLKIYVSAAVSVPYSGISKNPKYTRAENLISCWAMREIEGKRDSCIFEWLLCLDLKGYIPKYILDSAYTTLMQDYMSYLRKYIHELRQRRKRLKEV